MMGWVLRVFDEIFKKSYRERVSVIDGIER